MSEYGGHWMKLKTNVALNRQAMVPGVQKVLELGYNFLISNCRTMKLMRFVFGI